MQSPVAEEKIGAQAVRFTIPVLAPVVKFDVAMGRHPMFRRGRGGKPGRGRGRGGRRGREKPQDKMAQLYAFFF